MPSIDCSSNVTSIVPLNLQANGCPVVAVVESGNFTTKYNSVFASANAFKSLCCASTYNIGILIVSAFIVPSV